MIVNVSVWLHNVFSPKFSFNFEWVLFYFIWFCLFVCSYYFFVCVYIWFICFRVKLKHSGAIDY